MPLNKFTIMM